MTAKDANYTLGEEFTSWLTYTLENLMLYLLVPIFSACSLLVFLYFPVIIGLSIFYIAALFINICKKFNNLPDDPDSEQWKKPQQIHAFLANMLGRLWNGKYEDWEIQWEEPGSEEWEGVVAFDSYGECWILSLPLKNFPPLYPS